MRPKSILLSLFLVLFIQPLFAGAARRGWTKLELSPVDGVSKPAPAALLKRFDAELIADYGGYSIVAVPKGIVAALEAQANQEDIRVRVRDDLDVLELPGASVDAREGIRGVPAEKLAREYPAGRPGVFVLQFSGPPRAEWIAEVQALGWTLSRYIPANGYLAVGTPELSGRTRRLPFVQWLDVYHPYQKLAYLTRDGNVHDLLFELPEGDGSASGIDAIRAAAQGAIEVRRSALDTHVYARMSGAAAEALLRHEMILSVGPRPRGEPSDERQVLSLTSNVTFVGSALAPTNPGTYWSWVTQKCPECLDMPASAWKVGIADGGLDNGVLSGGHNDLAGRKFYGNKFYAPEDADDPECAPTQLLCDGTGHGTLVSSIAVGNALTPNGTSPYKDGDQFRWGLGVAPLAGAFMTKIYSQDSFSQGHNHIDESNLLLWTADAAAAGVTVQNHSWNTTSEPAGSYSVTSRKFDIATRDADDVASPARTPLLFTVSSGNQGSTFGGLTAPGGTAKNVLTVGGSENYRPDAPSSYCITPIKAESFNNIMRASRTGTQDSGYFKPDVMAPGSFISNAYSSSLWSQPILYCMGDVVGGDPKYTGNNGTSFAAPVGAGAAMIVKRYLGTSPSSISPALTRAVLIAGARSMRGGQDRSKSPNQTISAVPSQQQGFGRLSFEDILNNSQKPVVYDQATTFTTPGQSYTTTVRVRDAAKPIKIALVWSDAPGTAGVISPLVNDLHLEVRRSSNPNVVYVGNRLAVTANDEESIAYPSPGSLPYDTKNNVEFFRLFVTALEDVTITVTAAAINGDTNGNPANFEQDFALAVLNAQVPCVPGAITQQPQSQTIVPGTSANLSVAASGAGPFIYQWYRAASPNQVNPVGGNLPTFNTGILLQTEQYWVRVTDTCGGVVHNSMTATITVQCTAAPAITQQPASQTVNPGQPATLSVTATQAVSYQWYIGASGVTTNPIAGATSSTLVVAPTTTTSYWVRVSNGCGQTNSVTATVTVNPLITRRQTSFSLVNSQTSITASWPQPTQAGNLLVAVISADMSPNSWITFNAPAGWTQAVTYAWARPKLAIYYLPNNAGGRTSETFTASLGFHDMTLYLLEYSGIVATNPLDKTAFDGNATNNGSVQTGFTQNTVQAKELVITALTTDAQASFSTVPADGYTEIYDKNVLFHLTTAMYEKITNATGSYGHGATVSVPGQQWVGVVATFKGVIPN
jgi:Subtilase family/Ig-like domain CHU_C associated